MNLKTLSDEVLLIQTKKAAREEIDATLRVLHHLREVERRQLHLKSHSTMHEYCVNELGYDDGAAHLRLSSMRLLREIPEAEEKFESGSLNLTLLSKAQRFFKNEEISDPEEKREVLEAIEGKSTRDAEKTLLSRTDTPEKHIPERVRPISETHSEVRLVVDDALLERLKELQALLAHSHPGASIKDVIEYAVKVVIEKKTPKAPKAQTEVPAAFAEKRPSLTAVKRAVWHRDGGRCGYVSADGRPCGSRHGIEYDHILPRALGGEDRVDNLRLRCRAHNRLAAIRVFGPDKIAQHVPVMRS